MDLGLVGKVAIVMASSKGLGKAIALELAKENAIVLISSRIEETLQCTAEEIKRLSNNPNVHYRVCDMGNADDIAALAAYAAKKFGRIDILINNTGGPKSGGFGQIADSDWHAAFEQNLLSYIRTSRAVLPFMKEQQYGRIINVASSSTKEVIDGLILSNTLRAGIVGFSKTLAREVAKDNILVNTVGPGRIMTGRITELNQAAADQQHVTLEEIAAKSEGEIPLGRYGEPEEFAKAVVFLASSANTYLTGQSLVIDGGLLKSL